MLFGFPYIGLETGYKRMISCNLKLIFTIRNPVAHPQKGGDGIVAITDCTQ